jgi:hypothetical protein
MQCWGSGGTPIIARADGLLHFLKKSLFLFTFFFMEWLLHRADATGLSEARCATFDRNVAADLAGTPSPVAQAHAFCRQGSMHRGRSAGTPIAGR